MTENSIAYFRRRAQFHLAMAATAEQGVAAIHRQLADLYMQRTLELRPGDAARVKRNAPAPIPAPSAAATMEIRNRTAPSPTNTSPSR